MMQAWRLEHHDKQYKEYVMVKEKRLMDIFENMLMKFRNIIVG